MTLNSEHLSREGEEGTVGSGRGRVGKWHWLDGPEPVSGEDNVTWLNGEVRQARWGLCSTTPKVMTATGSWPSEFLEAEREVTGNFLWPRPSFGAESHAP